MFSRGQSKIVDETENIAEDSVRKSTQIRIIDEAENIPEADLTVRGLARIVDETENIPETSPRRGSHLFKIIQFV